MDMQKLRKNARTHALYSLCLIYAKVFSFTNNNNHLCNVIDIVYLDSGWFALLLVPLLSCRVVHFEFE